MEKIIAFLKGRILASKKRIDEVDAMINGEVPKLFRESHMLAEVESLHSKIRAWEETLVVARGGG